MLLYHGGPILTSFTIYPLFYGNWTLADIVTMNDYLDGLARYLSGENAPANQQPTLRQYGVISAVVGTAVTANPAGIGPTRLSGMNIEGIIQASQQNGELPPFGPNTLILVLLAPGIIMAGDNYQGTCQGYHSTLPGFAPYGVVPYGCRPDLGPDYDPGLTSHEVFEAATDPMDDGFDTAWAAETGEVSDLCNMGIPLPSGPPPLPQFNSRIMAGAFDNVAGGCSTTGYVPSVQIGLRHGYVWADQPTLTSYTPNTTYQFNSYGAVNTITRLALGRYRVIFPGIGDTGGTVNVTAYGSNGEICKVEQWSFENNPNPSGIFSQTDAVVYVRCFNATGTPADARFTVSYSNWKRGGRQTYDMACLWANDPTSNSYRADPYYQYNPADPTAAVITRLGMGDYIVRVPGMGVVLPGDPHSGGIVHVTAYGEDSNWSKVAWWERRGSDLVVRVLCFTAAGVPADSRFALTYHRRADLLGRFSAHHAYVWANNETAAKYTPISKYQYNTKPGDIFISRSGPGDYLVQIPGQNLAGGHVHVTAFGTAPERCEVISWGNDSIHVQCFAAAGLAADSKFALSFIAG